MEKRIEWDDIDVVVVFTKEDEVPAVNFSCYEVTGRTADSKGEFTVKHFERKGATSSEDETENINDAQTIIRGYIKWDSCSHVNFGDEKGYMHLCGKESWNQISEALQRIFLEAGKLLKEGHNDDFFD